MVRLQTLNELSQLRETGFGRPAPRHGLQLLYWFAHDYVTIDIYGNVVPKIDPQSKLYGFHQFRNIIRDENDPLLPNQAFLYYEVGNLNAQNACSLPYYVREKYTGCMDNSNKDRIIVRLTDNDHFDRVYVTEHSTQSDFNHSRTYRVSQGLLKIIQTMERDDFLQKMKSVGQNVRLQSQSYYNPSPPPPPPPQNESWCTIL